MYFHHKGDGRKHAIFNAVLNQVTSSTMKLPSQSKSCFIFPILLGILLVSSSCGDLGKKLDDKLKLVNDKALKLDSLVNKELDNVNSLDSLINKEMKKVETIDSLVNKSTKRIDSLVTKTVERVTISN
jgi:hypothetical protein